MPPDGLLTKCRHCKAHDNQRYRQCMDEALNLGDLLCPDPLPSRRQNRPHIEDAILSYLATVRVATMDQIAQGTGYRRKSLLRALPPLVHDRQIHTRGCNPLPHVWSLTPIADEDVPGLTERLIFRRQVLDLRAQSLTFDQIAEHLDVTPARVEWCLRGQERALAREMAA